MRSWAKNLGWMAAGVVLTLAVAIAAGGVLAQDPGSGTGAAGSGSGQPWGWMGPMHRGGGHGGVLIDAVADSFGMTRAELLEAIREHRTIVNLANAKNVSLDTIKANIITAVEEQHDAAVAAGRITREQADQWLERMTQNLDQMLNATGPLGGSGPCGGGKGFRGGRGPGRFGPGPDAPHPAGAAAGGAGRAGAPATVRGPDGPGGRAGRPGGGRHRAGH